MPGRCRAAGRARARRGRWRAVPSRTQATIRSARRCDRGEAEPCAARHRVTTLPARDRAPASAMPRVSASRRRAGCARGAGGRTRRTRSRAARSRSARRSRRSGVLVPSSGTQNSWPLTTPGVAPTRIGTCQLKILVRLLLSLTCGGVTGDIQWMRWSCHSSWPVRSTTIQSGAALGEARPGR